MTGAGIGWALPEPTRSQADGEDPDPVEEDAEDPVPEEETPYAVYQYVPIGNAEFEPTSPINVVFPLERRTFEEVIGVFRDARWYPHALEHARYAYDRENDRWKRCDWWGAETVFGVASRMHVSCWSLGGTASVQAHIDTTANPKHGIHSYAAAATGVARLFARAGWDVDPDDPETIALGNRSPPDHDGDAMVIRG